MYLDAMAGDHRDDAELVGLVEPNPGRLAVHMDRLAKSGLDVSKVVTGRPDDFERVITESRADRAIITSPDYTHAELIARGLDDRPRGHSTDCRGGRTLRTPGCRDAQLSLFATKLGTEGGDQERLDRHSAVGHL
jgi:hypothetical protein